MKIKTRKIVNVSDDRNHANFQVIFSTESDKEYDIFKSLLEDLENIVTTWSEEANKKNPDQGELPLPGTNEEEKED